MHFVVELLNQTTVNEEGLLGRRNKKQFQICEWVVYTVESLLLDFELSEHSLFVNSSNFYPPTLTFGKEVMFLVHSLVCLCSELPHNK